MTDPANQPPVFLPEPDGYRDQPPPPPQQGRRHVHPDWDAVLAPGEAILWDGKADAPRLPGSRNPKLMVFLLIAATFMAAILGDTPFPVFLGIAAYLFFRRRALRAKDFQDRAYLLTDRAAYIATLTGARLTDIRAFPITPTLRLGLGPRSVAFATRMGTEGREEAEGFLDIPDAERVHDLIRDIQKAKA